MASVDRVFQLRIKPLRLNAERDYANHEAHVFLTIRRNQATDVSPLPEDLDYESCSALTLS